MGNRALDIANYVVFYALSKGKSINHLQLQKSLYYLEAIWLTKKGVSLFDDDIEMWRLGPVVPSVYHEYKIFGPSNITNIPKEYRTKKGSFFEIEVKEFDPIIISASTKSLIGTYIDKLIEVDGFTLVNKTHEHKLWKDHEKDINSGIRNITYDKEDIKKFFKKNARELEFVVQ